MPENHPNDELQVNRRLFLTYAATATTATAGAFGIALKSDALAQAQQYNLNRVRANGDAGMPYSYHNGP